MLRLEARKRAKEELLKIAKLSSMSFSVSRHP